MSRARALGHTHAAWTDREGQEGRKAGLGQRHPPTHLGAVRVHTQQPPALAAHVGQVRVGAVHQPVVEAKGHAVGEQRVAFHLSQADPSVFFPPLDGLPRDRHDRARRPGLALVADHVSQALVVHDAHEDFCLHQLAGEPVVQGLGPEVTVAGLGRGRCGRRVRGGHFGA